VLTLYEATKAELAHPWGSREASRTHAAGTDVANYETEVCEEQVIHQLSAHKDMEARPLAKLDLVRGANARLARQS
jgi:hypothetical protein